MLLLGLKWNLLIYDNGCSEWALVFKSITLWVDDAPGTGPPDLHHEGDDSQEHWDVEHQVCDGYPVLETTPIIEDDHIQILKTGADCDDHPAYQQAVISFQSPKYQHETTNDSKECVKNCIFNHWAKAHILIIALIIVFIIKVSNTFGIFNNVENCGNGCDDKLDDANDDDGFL